MAPSGKIIIDISSDEDEGSSNQGAQFLPDVKLKMKLKKKFNIKKILDDDDDDDCVILDGDPDKQLRVDNESTVLGSESDELVIVAEKGQVACRDYPHARHLCARFPFSTNPHEKYCALCHCYVCDTLAPCDYWGKGTSSVDHCHATDKVELWRILRQCFKEGSLVQLVALINKLSTPANSSPPHPTTSLSQSLSGGGGTAVTVGSMVTASDQLTVQSERLTAVTVGSMVTASDQPSVQSERSTAVTVGSMVTASDQPTVQSERSTAVTVGSMATASDQSTVQSERLIGTVKWYNCQRGYGFIIPYSGGEDLFVHQSSIKSMGYRSLAEGEAVEFRIGTSDDGRTMAIEVTGLGASFVQGTTTTGSNVDGRGCYTCGEVGYLARNCSYRGNRSDDSDLDNSNNQRDNLECYKCGETGHLSRDCSCVVCYRWGKTGHLARNCSCTGCETDGNDSDGSDNGSNGTCKCYSCGETGHLARDCLHCYNCGKTGHLVRNCPVARGESDSGSNGIRKCFTCGEVGHLAKDCVDCNTCGKTGHLPRNCPNAGGVSDNNETNDSDTGRSNHRSDTRGCYNCGRVGHYARECSFTQDSDTSEVGQPVVQAKILTGTVKWFNSYKGYGFIIPNDGGQDLFVHQSSIKSNGFRSVAEGEVVEFQIERGDDGRTKAVDVTGPGGSYVKGTPRKVGHNVNKYYGQTGIVARNRSNSITSIPQYGRMTADKGRDEARDDRYWGWE